MSDEIDKEEDEVPSVEVATVESSPAVEMNEAQTLAEGHLSPRHRRLCQLAAAGSSNAQIKKELGYSDSRVSILLRHPAIVAEIRRLQDRIFEETIQARLKSFADPALSNIQAILTDRSNRVKVSEKMALSQWVVEKLDGKATQKTDIGENLLGVLMDRLDALRSGAGRPSQPAIDVTPRGAEVQADSAASETKERNEDELASWVRDFCASEDA